MYLLFSAAAKLKSYLPIVILTITTIILIPSQADGAPEEAPPENVIQNFLSDTYNLKALGETEPSNIHYAKIDVNGDGQMDWYLEHPKACNGLFTSCHGTLYLKAGNVYCYAGGIRRSKIFAKNKEIECR